MLPSKLRRPSKASRRSKTAGQTPGQNNARGTDELIARRGNISTDRSLFHCGCCVSTCELCDPSLSGRSQRSPSCSPTTDSDLVLGADPFGDGAHSEDLPQLEESQPTNPQGG